MKTKTISLSEKELKLLMMILEECEDDRSSMGCNDPYEDEEKLFTKKERIEIAKTMIENEDDEEMDGFLFNHWFVQHIINIIKKQTDKPIRKSKS